MVGAASHDWDIETPCPTLFNRLLLLTRLHPAGNPAASHTSSLTPAKAIEQNKSEIIRGQ